MSAVSTPSLEQPHDVNPMMHSAMATSESFIDVDRQVPTKPDHHTNIDGNIFAALVGKNIFNIVSGEKLENTFDSDLELEPNNNYDISKKFSQEYIIFQASLENFIFTIWIRSRMLQCQTSSW